MVAARQVNVARRVYVQAQGGFAFYFQLVAGDRVNDGGDLRTGIHFYVGRHFKTLQFTLGRVLLRGGLHPPDERVVFHILIEKPHHTLRVAHRAIRLRHHIGDFAAPIHFQVGTHNRFGRVAGNADAAAHDHLAVVHIVVVGGGVQQLEPVGNQIQRQFETREVICEHVSAQNRRVIGRVLHLEVREVDARPVEEYPLAVHTPRRIGEFGVENRIPERDFTIHLRLGRTTPDGHIAGGRSRKFLQKTLDKRRESVQVQRVDVHIEMQGVGRRFSQVEAVHRHVVAVARQCRPHIKTPGLPLSGHERDVADGFARILEPGNAQVGGKDGVPALPEHPRLPVQHAADQARVAAHHVAEGCQLEVFKTHLER